MYYANYISLFSYLHAVNKVRIKGTQCYQETDNCAWKSNLITDVMQMGKRKQIAQLIFTIFM